MNNKTLIIAGLVFAIIIGVLAVFFASGDPDGLESTALVIKGEKTLFGPLSVNPGVTEGANGGFSYSAPLPDYSMGEKFGHLGQIVAMLAGIIIAFVLVIGVSKVVRKISEKRKPN